MDGGHPPPVLGGCDLECLPLHTAAWKAPAPAQMPLGGSWSCQPSGKEVQTEGRGAPPWHPSVPPRSGSPEASWWEVSTSSPTPPPPPGMEVSHFIFESLQLTSSWGGARLADGEPLGPVRTLSDRLGAMIPWRVGRAEVPSSVAMTHLPGEALLPPGRTENFPSCLLLSFSFRGQGHSAIGLGPSATPPRPRTPATELHLRLSPSLRRRGRGSGRGRTSPCLCCGPNPVPPPQGQLGQPQR